MELSENATSTVYELGVENELRVVTGDEKRVSIELLSGYAEIFGSELAQNTSYTFSPNSCVSVYSWEGCSIKLSGEAVESCVTSTSSIMISVKIHACLEERRIIAKSNFEKGPVSLIVGSMQSGKSTFCHFLLNYAARMGRSPLYIDLDVMQNRSLMPGTISMFKIDQPSHITNGFSKHAFYSYLYGHTHPRKNTLLYYLLIKKLGEIAEKRLCKEKANMYSSGVIIDAHSWNKKKGGYNIIRFTAKIFKVDVIFVISNKKMFKKLKNDISCNVNVVFIPRQKRVIQYNNKQREQNQQNSIWQYFYGTIQSPLTPYIFDLKFSDIDIYSVVLRGKENNLDEININILNISIKEEELENCILGLSSADTVNENLLTTSVKGFICVMKIDLVQEIITILSPEPAPLPSRILIYGRVKFTKTCETLNK